jgi:hypothetical protein
MYFMTKKIIVGILGILIALPIGYYIFIKIFDKEPIGKILEKYGYTEIKPPSTLVQPGTWVSVLNKNPLHLNIVCTPTKDVLDKTIIKSDSIDTNMMSKLSGLFEMEGEKLDVIKGKTNFKEVKNISFRLKNIQLLELPDEVIFEKIVPSLSESCKKSIKFHFDAKEEVSIITAVLVADSDYQVELSHEMENKTASDLKGQLALETNSRLSNDESSNIIGKNLIWGIRDNPRYASAGLFTPPTGGFNDSPILRDKGAITSISSNGLIRMEFPKENRIVKHDGIPLLKQSSDMSCWATVYTMMKSWRDGRELSVNNVVTDLGEPWKSYYLKDIGLPPEKIKDFAETVYMETKPPANYTLEAYVEMLQKSPLWIMTGNGFIRHARLLIGVYGNPNADGIKKYEDSTFEFIDPLVGTYSYESGLEFVRSFEKEAIKLDKSEELKSQILYWENKNNS